ncbi:hypothetical protein CspeluHIS016_0305370 [Cutaneotrichosporon spelunceum]|uniref:Cytochrome b561 domain-containing protein n=1 Tax=Cutaneotrichosporon spelunceum TaxID=1672016 RepID=A0AAD3TUD5_9TREE|nr:hypothetical protein CspeluHIS016_0305370 [Cutaneotrichosporon spelunceum]
MSHVNQPLLASDARPTPEAAYTLADMAPTQRDKTGLALVLTGTSLLVLCTAALILTSPVPRLFAWHPPLNSLALALFALGIATVQPPTPPAAVRATRLGVHKNVLGTAVLLLCAGTTFMYYNKEANGAEHGTTPHGSAGYIVLLWMLVQATIGGVAANTGKSGMWLYNLSGYLFITLALVTACAGGLLTDWARTRPAPLRVIAYGLGIPLIAAGLAMRVHPSKMAFGKRRA